MDRDLIRWAREARSLSNQAKRLQEALGRFAGAGGRADSAEGTARRKELVEVCQKAAVASAWALLYGGHLGEAMVALQHAELRHVLTFMLRGVAGGLDLTGDPLTEMLLGAVQSSTIVEVERKPGPDAAFQKPVSGNIGILRPGAVETMEKLFQKTMRSYATQARALRRPQEDVEVSALRAKLASTPPPPPDKSWN